MLSLRQRADVDISTVIGWIPEARALYLFTGSRLVWPLTVDQLAAMTVTGDVIAFVMVDDGSLLIGHFDLSLADETARIGRVIVDPAKRGRGYGGALVGLAVESARSFGARRIALNVIADNAPAVVIYERAGFQHLPMGDRPDVRSMALTL
ncbi:MULTISPECIES: GNAT family N-acetyltransferase [Bacteria]|jgi:RimJ/RimL family protein N-acetyltransferase